MYTAQMAEFCDALRDGPAAQRRPARTSRVVMRVVEEAYRSAGVRAAAMTLVLGIDGGGTKTHAVIADADGAVRGFATSGPANWEVVGLRGAGESLREATRRALQAAGAESGDLSGGRLRARGHRLGLGHCPG